MAGRMATRRARAVRSKRASPTQDQHELADDNSRLAHQQSTLGTTAASVLSLQRRIGNSAVTGALQRQVYFRQSTGEVTKPKTDQVTTWLSQGSVSVEPLDVQALIDHEDA